MNETFPLLLLKIRLGLIGVVLIFLSILPNSSNLKTPKNISEELEHLSPAFLK